MDMRNIPHPRAKIPLLGRLDWHLDIVSIIRAWCVCGGSGIHRHGISASGGIGIRIRVSAINQRSLSRNHLLASFQLLIRRRIRLRRLTYAFMIIQLIDRAKERQWTHGIQQIHPQKPETQAKLMHVDVPLNAEIATEVLLEVRTPDHRLIGGVVGDREVWGRPFVIATNNELRHTKVRRF